MLSPKLNGNQLKLIAVVTMLIDHIGYLIGKYNLFYRQDYAETWRMVYVLLRGIGRIAFPIFCFMLVEGFQHTGNRRRYLGRMAIFAVISELPYNWMVSGNWWDPQHQNVFFTLFLGLLMMQLMEMISEKSSFETGRLLQMAVICGAGILAWVMRTDYSYWGIVLIAILYLARQNRLTQCILAFLWQMWCEELLLWKAGLLCSFVLLLLYDGTRTRTAGRKWQQYFFYWFYPVHILVLTAVGLWISKQ